MKTYTPFTTGTNAYVSKGCRALNLKRDTPIQILSIEPTNAVRHYNVKVVFQVEEETYTMWAQNSGCLVQPRLRLNNGSSFNTIEISRFARATARY